MNKDYQQIVAALDYLSAPELVALLEQITQRLKAHVGDPIPDEIPQEDSNRRYLPRLPQMIQWGLVVPLEDKLHVRDKPNSSALLLDASRVAYQGEAMPINDWAKHITGWKSVNIYESVIVVRTGQTLSDLRQAYIDENDWA